VHVGAMQLSCTWVWQLVLRMLWAFIMPNYMSRSQRAPWSSSKYSPVIPT
jgi:hypothetical protein